ncbi:GNAT family N-acetyltransferase [Priestia megaterium NCT-2]|uniref:GNAT family N-acetyltransferase n=1 Tax=Priestia megaterium TaxID=1404 RepID=UPI0003450F70|nr:GNAT family N-acetyltransferase [Priestia megaterium]AYE52768.1 GNAT family N-acetyltransferase [Priestia megaterium NCT-2]
MEIIYRTAKLDDYTEVNKILGESLELHANALPSMFDNQMAVLSQEQYQATLYYATIDILVAQYRNQIIGASVVELKYNPPTTLAPLSYTAYIQYFGVKKGFQNYGVGKSLFSATKQWAVQKGASDLQLTVWAFNEKARAFYESLGLKNLSYLMTTSLQP